MMMNYNPFSLEGKTILITGASSGIGKSTAIECSKLGARLFLTGRDKGRLNNTLMLCCGVGHNAMTADLSIDEDIERIAADSPSLDGAFFCAGITGTTLAKFYTREKWEHILNINLISPALLTRHLLSNKKINKSASLVYMSSYGAEKVGTGLGIYSASKIGVNALTHAVAKELVSRHIRANSIMPGMVQTEMVDNLTSFSEDDLNTDRARYPFGYGRPEDVAYAAIYLLSDASQWVTNTQIRMDGGFTL